MEPPPRLSNWRRAMIPDDQTLAHLIWLIDQHLMLTGKIPTVAQLRALLAKPS